jgi:hypothetical protein
VAKPQQIEHEHDSPTSESGLKQVRQFLAGIQGFRI